MCDSGPKTPRREQLPCARSEGPVALGQRHSDERILPRCLGGHSLDLRRVDPHRFLHQEGIPLLKQVVGDPSHLAVPPECKDEVGSNARQHLSVISEVRGVPYLGRSFHDEIGVGVLDSDQFHIWHGDEVAKVGGIVERMPVAYLDGRDANGHGRLPVICSESRNITPRQQ